MNAEKSNRHKRLLAAAAGMGLSLLAAAPATRADSAVAWGFNVFGGLGNGSNSSTNAAVAVVGLSSGVTAVAGGGGHSLAIHNGTVKTWGRNDEGELGNGSNTSSNVPVVVTGLTSGVTAVAGGGYFSLAIQNGAAKAWGENFSGQLGNGTTGGYRSVPVAVTGLSSGVTAVAGGGLHGLAIQNGAAKAWGRNDEGQLGNGSNTRSNVPVVVTGLSSGVTTMAGGRFHSLAIQNGAAKAWGDNSYAQLGNGSNTSGNVPVAVTGLSSGVTSVAGGAYHSLAIQNGNVYAWGDSGSGQLGIGSTNYSTTPVLALDTPADLVAVAAGWDSSYALSADGSLWVWGGNGDGQLGLGTTGGRSTTPQHLLAPSGFIFTRIDADTLSSHAVATLAAVPEPTSFSLLALGGVTVLARRRQRSH